MATRPDPRPTSFTLSTRDMHLITNPFPSYEVAFIRLNLATTLTVVTVREPALSVIPWESEPLCALLAEFRRLRFYHPQAKPLYGIIYAGDWMRLYRERIVSPNCQPPEPNYFYVQLAPGRDTLHRIHDAELLFRWLRTIPRNEAELVGIPDIAVSLVTAV
ncbi:uncharacterized protein BO95DRAFT_458612 [Aspergillus brunneoviolaceus CBS 621.78]|uniref:Uncharacterized protein n=1 Tax=Aspergillus brunneoviolaceus CBS 621.78 TaxID=1450534 RepID=A0ACD1GQ80_9EURO|nr:hypothetical protein BO95DRAFT_458612 [Aspergillus brunneoviolaceus CBS 621.78]RAH51259.1 hypothetical protein BO95DRAFT_458612 [Aspergillus brunneoviolaceus CBS 621.78]